MGFQLLRLEFLFHFVVSLFRLLLFGPQLPDVGFKLSRLPFQLTIVLDGVPCFRETDATLQTVLRHRCGVALVIGDHLFTSKIAGCHRIIRQVCPRPALLSCLRVYQKA